MSFPQSEPDQLFDNEAILNITNVLYVYLSVTYIYIYRYISF